MLKKIALVGVFAVTSIVSFNPKSNAASQPPLSDTAFKSPVVRGMCSCPGMKC